MWTYLVFSLALLLPLASANYGPIGTCNQTKVNGFIGALPNGDMCGAAYLTVLNPSTAASTDSYEAALALFCSADCGQKITKMSAVDCGSDGFDAAIGFFLWCLPREPTNDRCRSIFPDLVEADLVAALASCLNFNATCPDNCAAALSAATTAFGCCYQTVYNNTKVVQSLAAAGVLDAMTLAIIDATQNQALWWACNASLISACDGNPFPGTPTVPFGVCTGANLTSFVATMTAPSCSAGYTTLYFTPGPTDEQIGEALDDICQNDCVGEVAGYLKNKCQDTFTGALTNDNCLETDGEIGDRCYFIADIGDDVFGDAGNACFSLDEDCPTGCADSLQKIKNQLGCCYQSIFNDTTTLVGLFVNATITYEDLEFFKALSYPGIWNRCDVSIQDTCSDPFTEAGALKFAASMVMVLSLIILPLIL